MKQVCFVSKMMNFTKFYSLIQVIDRYQKQKRTRIEPCGTAYKTEAKFESWSIIETNCFLSDK